MRSTFVWLFLRFFRILLYVLKLVCLAISFVVLVSVNLTFWQTSMFNLYDLAISDPRRFHMFVFSKLNYLFLILVCLHSGLLMCHCLIAHLNLSLIFRFFLFVNACAP